MKNYIKRYYSKYQVVFVLLWCCIKNTSRHLKYVMKIVHRALNAKISNLAKIPLDIWIK